jgi:small subunit ribosomal protein S2
MKELEQVDFEDTTRGFTKKELLMKRRELEKLHKSLGGIRNLTKTPSAIWVVDAKREHLAMSEAAKLGIPVVGILDTNADPDEIQFPIPGNDDAIRSVGLLTRVIADAVAEGLVIRHDKPTAAGNVSAVEPLADWERELLGEVADVAAEAPVAEAPAADAEVVAEAPAEEAPAAESADADSTDK